jgi:hypothetical protein
MQKFKLIGSMFLAGLFGMALTLLVWRAVTDYQAFQALRVWTVADHQDFVEMRKWTAKMIAFQEEAAKQQQARQPAPPPAEVK